jgi:polar amino acid transport system substrate-binding protein
METKGGKSAGLAVDLLRAAATRVGIDLEFVATPIDRLKQAPKEALANAIFLRITPEDRGSFDFSAPVLTTGSGLFVRAPNIPPQNLMALTGKLVATPRAGPLATLIRQTAPNVNLVTTADYEDSLARVAEGSADAAALNFHAGRIIAGRIYPTQINSPDHMFAEGQLAVAVLKGQHSEFLVRLNAGLSGIRLDGTWQQINNGWVGR